MSIKNVVITMEISNTEIFKRNLKYLFGIVKAKTGITKGEAMQAMRLSKAADHKWFTRGAIYEENVLTLVAYFDRYVDFPLSPERLINIDLQKLQENGNVAENEESIYRRKKRKSSSACAQ